MKNKRIVFLLCMVLTGLNATAQEAITVSGGLASGNNGTVSYTLGQVTYGTNIGVNGSISQGVQQSYDVSIVNGIEMSKISMNISAYPNPTNNYLKLKVELMNIENMSYLLCDMLGKPLQNQQLKSSETSIEMTDLVPSTYFVKVLDNSQVIKTFKIIKY